MQPHTHWLEPWVKAAGLPSVPVTTTALQLGAMLTYL